jgi:hypothetical protein
MRASRCAGVPGWGWHRSRCQGRPTARLSHGDAPCDRTSHTASPALSHPSCGVDVRRCRGMKLMTICLRRFLTIPVSMRDRSGSMQSASGLEGAVGFGVDPRVTLVA